MGKIYILNVYQISCKGVNLFAGHPVPVFINCVATLCLTLFVCLFVCLSVFVSVLSRAKVTAIAKIYMSLPH